MTRADAPGEMRAAPSSAARLHEPLQARQPFDDVGCRAGIGEAQRAAAAGGVEIQTGGDGDACFSRISAAKARLSGVRWLTSA